MDASTVIIAILLTLIVILLVVIAFGQKTHPHYDEQVAIDASAILREVELATRHYVNVSAVVEMVQQLEELDEGALERLKLYPESVRAAAWLHLIDQLGQALRDAQTEFAQSYIGQAHTAATRQHRKEKVEELRAMLDRAIELSVQTDLRVV